MSGISTGIGLISGINTSQLLDQLMAIERRPIDNLQTRVKTLDTQRAKFMELSAKLLGIRNSIANFNKIDFFKRFKAASSNEGVLTAAAGSAAAAGSTTFRVHSLVTSHTMVSRGFADAERASIGVGTLTVEVGRGRVNPTTPLDALNGGRGVRRGAVQITDRSGATAQVDLSRAFTVDDVLSAINANADINVRASVTSVTSGTAAGDRIVIEDLSGGTGNLIVADVAGGSVAADLGITADAASPRVDGRGVLYLSMDTPLSLLNDGNGVDRLGQGAIGDDLSFTTSFGRFGVLLTDVLRLSTDLRAVNGGNGVRLGVIRITDRTGATAEVDLTAARTVQEVRDAINASGLNIEAATVNSRMFVTDKSQIPAENAKKFKIEDISGFAAADLGIADEVAGDSINGRDIYRMATVGDLIRAINFASGNDAQVVASISADGTGITLEAMGFDNTVTVSAGQDSSGIISGTAHDLGLAGAGFSTNQTFTTRRLMAGMNTVLLHSLRGGRGVSGGTVSFTDRTGQTATIDLSHAQTLQEVIDLINHDATISLTASINASGNGIVLRDESAGTGPIMVTDVAGTLAADMGLSGTFEPTTTEVKSGNLQLQYVARRTALSELNFGRGVTGGTMLITDSQSNTYAVNIAGNLRTVGQVLDKINEALPDTLDARINDTGDGILITDTTGGLLPLTIKDQEGSKTAADLRIAGIAKTGQNFIDGTFETRVEIGPADTLRTIVSRLNSIAGGFSASVVNDGGNVSPYGLMLTSAVSGRRGELIVEAGGLDLGFDTLTRAHDAVISVGSTSGAGGLLVTSATNKLDGIMEGVSINLVSAKNEDVTINVEQDIDGIVESVQEFVEKYNDMQDAIAEATSFNADTLQRGPLLGDATVGLIQGRLHRVMTQAFTTGGAKSRLFSVGLRLGEGNRLEFDEQRFRDSYADAPQDVERLFAEEASGFGKVMQDVLDQMTRDFDGVLPRKDELLGDQQKVLNDRIESLGVLLEGKRRRLEAQFAALESSLAALQGQQTALGALAQLLQR
jgi:flagellar hook-associated protein 2